MAFTASAGRHAIHALERAREKAKVIEVEGAHVLAGMAASAALGFVNTKNGAAQGNPGDFKIANKLPLDLTVGVLGRLVSFAGMTRGYSDALATGAGDAGLFSFANRLGMTMGAKAAAGTTQGWPPAQVGATLSGYTPYWGLGAYAPGHESHAGWVPTVDSYAGAWR